MTGTAHAAVYNQEVGIQARAPPAQPAAGVSTRAFPRHCAQALADELGRPLAEFPGGHSVPILRPRAFAARLRDMLATCQ